MKRSALLVFASSALLVAPFVACEDSSSSPPYDAGTFETSLAPQDGATTDSPTTDAPQEAALPTTATVVVTKSGAPDANVTVVFHAADGTVTSTAVTGADGRATGKVVDGSQITVALGAAGSRQLLTYVGVKPGDLLNVVERTQRDVSVTINPGNPGGGISVIAGNFSCSTNAASSAAPVSLVLTPECITGATFPVLDTLVFNGARYFSFKKGNTPAAALADGGPTTTTVTGLSAWAQGTAFTLDVTNAPATTSPYAYLAQIAENQGATFGPEGAFTLAAGAGSAPFSVAAGYADAYQGELQDSTYIGGYQQTLSFSKRIAAGAGVTSQTLDLAPGMLPKLLTLVASKVDPSRPVLTWTAAGSLATTDSGVLTLAFQQPTDASFETIEWSFVVPPGTLTVTAPVLPAQLAAYTPASGAFLGQPSLAFFESDLLPSYDVVRAQAAAFGLARVPTSGFSNLQAPALPANGTLRITAISPGG